MGSSPVLASGRLPCRGLRCHFWVSAGSVATAAAGLCGSCRVLRSLLSKNQTKLNTRSWCPQNAGIRSEKEDLMPVSLPSLVPLSPFQPSPLISSSLCHQDCSLSCQPLFPTLFAPLSPGYLPMRPSGPFSHVLPYF